MMVRLYHSNSLPAVVITMAILVLVCTSQLAAQSYPDSKGTDFWFSFLPNFHNGYDSLDAQPNTKLEHELYILISAEQATTGTIALKDRLGATRIEPFTISDPSQIFEFRTYFKPYELLGFNRSGALDYVGMQTEKIAEQSIHIMSDNEVTVYALNQASLTSDAFLVLPTDALAEDYIVASYTSDIDYLTFPNQVPASSSTPSQFCVVATADSTVVEILPTAPTFLSPNQELQTIVLMKGQSYLVQVDPRATNNGDLTGSVVRASKPVAVFGGHQRAIVPIEEQATLGSRDCLIEQMNPVQTWGKNAFIFPLAISSDEVSAGSNRFRVVAGFDSTQVFLGNTPVSVLNRGEFYEGILNQAVEVRTSKAAMVYLLKKTTGSGGTVLGSRIGDPFMMLVPPAEQFMKQYRFTNVQANTYNINLFNGKIEKGPIVYVEQYLAVVIANEGLPSLILDGTPIGDGRFQPIPGTGYSWATMTMKDGIHEITSDTTFGIYVYGYGEANSYGYIGGMAFRPLDVQPPTFQGQATCGTFRGTVADSIIGDSRVKSAQILPGSEVNVAATIAPFNPPARVVEFSASLVNRFDDGLFVIEATDNVRQTSLDTIDVPGFTVAAVTQDANSPIPTHSKVVAHHQMVCDTVFLENYGKFPHTITALRTVLGATIVAPVLPYVIQPNEILPVYLCMLFDSIGVINDTLIVQDTCIDRRVIKLLTDVRADERGPYTTLETNPCDSVHLASVGDDRAYDYGLLSCTIIDSVISNCTLTEIDRTAYKARYRLVVTDPLKDAVYGFNSVDSAGNVSSYIDTIPGFTLAFEGIGDGYLNAVGMASQQVGTMRCDTVWLTNYGVFPQVVNNVYLHRNTVFSVPLNQFPITVLPGSRSPLTICYQPQHTLNPPDIDTLDFFDSCLVKALEVRAVAEQSTFTGLSRCDVHVETNVFSVGQAIHVFPNPASGQVTVALDSIVGQLDLQVLNVQGDQILHHTWSGQASATFLLDITGISRGTFVVVARYANRLGTAIIAIH